MEHTSVRKGLNPIAEANLRGMEFAAKDLCVTNATDVQDARQKHFNAGMTTTAFGAVTRYFSN